MIWGVLGVWARCGHGWCDSSDGGGHGPVRTGTDGRHTKVAVGVGGGGGTVTVLVTYVYVVFLSHLNAGAIKKGLTPRHRFHIIKAKACGLKPEDLVP